MAETKPFDPTAHTVAQVNEYLETAEPSEVERVLAAEADAEARKGILEGPHAAQDEPEQPAPQAETTTKGLAFHEAAKAVTVAETGFIGESPERERTGLADKGLSQQSILNG